MAHKAYEWDGKGYGRRVVKPALKLCEGEPMAGDQHVFAVGCQASKGSDRYNIALIVRASSRDEALGKGFRLARQAFPAANGFSDWNVFCSRPDKVTEPGDELNLIWE